MKTTHIWPEEIALVNGEWLASATMEHPDGKRKPIEYRIPEELGPSISDRHDHFLLAAIFSAMRTGDACHVHGHVTNSLLVNLSEFSSIWNVWKPETYRPLDLVSDSVVPSRPNRNDRSWLAAFSGGADACATLLRHTTKPIGWRTRPVKAALLLQGFDLPEENAEAFSIAKRSAQTIASSVGLPLHTMRTNIRQLGDNWEYAFGALIVSCLSVLSSGFDGAVLSGDDSPYTQQQLYTWGSNPISNHLLGSNHFPLYTDSGELSRLQKVGMLRDWPEAIRNVRVCWEGPLTGANCGICEKCIRTQLEFLVHGIDASESFAHRLEPGDVRKIAPHSPAHLVILAEILSACDERKISGWWVSELRTVVKRGVREKREPLLAKYRGRLGFRAKLREIASRTKGDEVAFPV